MPSYNAAEILALLNNNGKNNGAGSSKLTYWKATIGEHEIRFLPYSSADNKSRPFQEVLYYEKLSDRRMVAPTTFDMPDPVKDMFEKLRKNREGWNVAKHMQPRPRYYAVIMVRGEEAKGPQVWEFSKDLRDQILSILIHKDNVDEDMFSPETGYDFTLKVSQAVDPNGKPRSYNGNAVKQFTITPRKKPSKLSQKDAEATKWLEAMPKLDEIFKAQVKQPEELLEAVENFIAAMEGGTSNPTAGAGVSGEGTNATAYRNDENNGKLAPEVESKLKDAFGLDEDVPF